MRTVLSYFESADLTGQAEILSQGTDQNGFYLILDRTPFYPQGGGQPSDTGSIEVDNTLVRIHRVKSIDDEIRHYVDQDCKNWIGKLGLCTVDLEKRILHSKLHTSGHLISNLIETTYPQWKNKKAHHFPKECYVEFTTQGTELNGVTLESLNQSILKIIDAQVRTQTAIVSREELKTLCPDLNFQIPSDQPVRIVRIGDFPFYPCGGTHVENTRDLTGLVATQIKLKSNSLKVYYDILS